MNHLAHCFLSFHDPDLLVGNFIGDDVKGRDWQYYAPGVQRGILLHRTIDAFTDEHPLTRQSAARIRPFAGRYAGPMIGILYDYLLARHWGEFTDEPFGEFVQKTYKVLENRRLEMPEPLRDHVPHMLAGDFLSGYTHSEGLEWVLERFSRRLSAGFDWKEHWAFFLENEPAFSADFVGFFPALRQRARLFLVENQPPGFL